MSTFTLLDLVLRAEGRRLDEFYRDSLYPVAYEFSNGATKRDSGPTAGVYEQDDE